MLRVALTGNVASGKSTVAGYFAGWGAVVIDADAIVRELQAPGSPILTEIAKAFGEEVITPSGALDRARLRARVLAEPEERETLNAIMHPAVQARRVEMEAEARAEGSTIVIHDIPLLFEVMDPGKFPVVILVDASEDRRLRRLLDRGLSQDEATALMATQMDATQKRSRATHIIDNNGTLTDLRARTQDVWNALQEQATRLLDSRRSER